jgi:hypothetical protein
MRFSGCHMSLPDVKLCVTILTRHLVTGKAWSYQKWLLLGRVTIIVYGWCGPRPASKTDLFFAMLISRPSSCVRLESVQICFGAFWDWLFSIWNNKQWTAKSRGSCFFRENEEGSGSSRNWICCIHKIDNFRASSAHAHTNHQHAMDKKISMNQCYFVISAVFS